VNQNGHIFEAYQVNFRNDLVNIIQEVRNIISENSINITGNKILEFVYLHKKYDLHHPNLEKLLTVVL